MMSLILLEPPPVLPEYKKPFMAYDDDIWVDEAKSILSSHGGKAKIGKSLQEMFEEHKDALMLLLAFLNRSGKNRHQKQSLVRTAVEEFKNWQRKCKKSHPK